MTDASEWAGAVGNIWAQEWRRTDRAFANLAPTLDTMIAAAAPATAFRALDVGCGAGATSLALAGRRPDATITGIDISPELIAVARDRAAGHSALQFVVGDVAALAPACGPFDLLFSRHGVMFFPDPGAAFATLRTAASAGATMVFSCFADPAENDFAGALAAAVEVPVPRAGDAPGPFAFARPADVEAMLAGTGWAAERRERVPFRYRVGDGEDAASDALSLLSRIGPAAAAMRQGKTDRRDAIMAKLSGFLQARVRDGAVDLPAAAWLWTLRAD